MAFGGGTFTTYDKIIPGVYANFENNDVNDLAPTTGTVAFLVPVLSTVVQFPKTTLVTPNNYKTIAIEFSSTGVLNTREIIDYCTEIFCNSHQIYLIPVKMISIDKENEVRYEIDLNEELTNREFNTLLCIDFRKDKFIIENTLKFINDILEKSNKRFVTLIYSEEGTAKGQIDVFPTKKWLVFPHHINSSFYTAGLLASLNPGESSAGHVYSGSWDASEWIPKTIEEQETCLNTGLFCFYSLGNSYRVLKDITYAHQKTNPPAYNDTIGSIVRLEKYMYDWFSYIYATQMQGQPNNKLYRSLFKTTIYSHLRDLEEMNVIQNVRAEDVSVEPIEKQPNALLITIQYRPVSGIDYVYIKFAVD